MAEMDGMDCEHWQTAISARADGEDPGVTERLLDAHLATCPSCRSFAAAIDGSRRRLVVQPAPVMPDLSHQVSKLNAVADRASRWGVVRALLLVVAAEVIVLSAPSLFDSANHDGRHLGAFSVSYGVALAVVAVRPARARTVLPVSMVLAGALTITALVDLARGVVPLVNEATHLPELLSVLLVWLLTVPPPRRDRTVAPSDARPSSGAPALRVVRDDGDDAGRHAV
ncbi:MAG: zf-HC2 domain-containing protein [Acidimicrobiales bacterium]